MLKLTNQKVLILALILAAGASFGVYQFISAVQAPQPVKKVQVLVAADDVPTNKVITNEMVTIQHIPEEFAHPKALRGKKEAVGKVCKVSMLQGEQVLISNVASKDQSGNRFSYHIPDKHRAITINVNMVSNVAGFPTVGDRVDILLTAGDKVITMLQNKEILATGGIIFPQEDGEQRDVPTVTLSVTPQEAQIIALAETKGKMRFTLRSPVDKEAVSLQPITKLPNE